MNYSFFVRLVELYHISNIYLDFCSYLEYYQILKNLREDRDIKQSEIAKLLGTSQSYYAQYENGKRPIPFERVMQLAIFYGVSLDYIAGRTNKKENPNL